MQVAKWGNSLAIRLPAKLVRELGLKEGDQVDLTAGTAALEVHRLPGADEILQDLRQFRGRLSAAQRLTRDAANER